MKLHRASLLFLVVAACGGSPAPAPAVSVPVVGVQPTAEQPTPSVVERAPIAAPMEIWNDAEAFVPVSSSDPTWGSRGALVTLVEFADFQCPYCSRSAVTVEQLKTDYGPEKLRVVWKNFPLAFHPNARPAAEAAEGVFRLAGKEAFWKFYGLAFANQAALNVESFAGWAATAGVVDLAAYAGGFDTHAYADKVSEDQKVGERVGVRGTPAFFINGVFLSGAQPIDAFKKVIDAELTKAEAKVAAGVPRDRVYVVASQENKVTPPPSDPPKPAEDTKTVWKVPATGPARGNRGALVTIVEFADFQCPFCVNVEPTLKALAAKYGSDLRFVWRNEPLPFHHRAKPAAELALEARAELGDAGFWDAHDRLMAQSRQLEDADLQAIGSAMHLNAAKVDAAIQHDTHARLIEADQDAAEDFGAEGTPSFFINGRRIVGARPQADFETIIDEEIVRARALVAKGTAPAALYETLIKDGKPAAPFEKRTAPPITRVPSKGKPNAKVTIQIFSDFQCPFCARVEPTVAEIMKTYGTRINFVWRNFPLAFHQNAPLAAEAAMEAFAQKGSVGFWAMHDKIFANNQDLARATLDGYAQDLHLDMTRWTAALDGSTHKAEIDADIAAGSAAQVTGTPAFFIGDYFVSGAQPFAKFRRVIDRALADRP